MLKKVLKKIIPIKYRPFLKKIYASYTLIYSKNKRIINTFFLSKTIKDKLKEKKVLINLCSGNVLLDDYINIDIDNSCDLKVNLNKQLLPLNDNCTDVLVCMSAINFFDYERASIIIDDIFRILKPEGIVRIGVQDLRLISRKYLDNDYDFFFQINKDYKQRFPGKKVADKVNYFFNSYGHKYMWDFESLEYLFKKSGFENIENKDYLESKIDKIEKIDNRPEMFFYLEAKKPNELYYFEKAKILLNQGKKSQAWQLILKALDINLYNSKIMHFAVDIMIEEDCLDAAKQLIDDYSYKSNSKDTNLLRKKLKKYYKEENQSKLSNNKKKLRDIFNNER